MGLYSLFLDGFCPASGDDSDPEDKLPAPQDATSSSPRGTGRATCEASLTSEGHIGEDHSVDITALVPKLQSAYLETTGLDYHSTHTILDTPLKTPTLHFSIHRAGVSSSSSLHFPDRTHFGSWHALVESRVQ